MYIVINPNHQRHTHRRLDGFTSGSGPNVIEDGSEFQAYLDIFDKAYPTSQLKEKIINIAQSKKDIVSCALEIRKRVDDDLEVCILNASDPDVTLGNHVGEYVNNVPHTSTTEENFAAIGTSGLCWEWLSQARQNDRVHQSNQGVSEFRDWFHPRF